MRQAQNWVIGISPEKDTGFLEEQRAYQEGWSTG